MLACILFEAFWVILPGRKLRKSRARRLSDDRCKIRAFMLIYEVLNFCRNEISIHDALMAIFTLHLSMFQCQCYAISIGRRS